MRAILQADAPGSLMLFGEHAVLHGHRALVCAVDRRLRVRLAPRADGRLAIRSALGDYEAPIEAPGDAPRLRFVQAAVGHLRDRLPGGCALDIESDIPSDLGLGSSAAVVVATLAALRAWADGVPPRPDALLAEAREVIRAVQGMGSGADAAASIHGGVVAFRAEPLQAERLAGPFPITAAYAGSKTPTPEVVRRVDAFGRGHPALHRGILALLGRVSEEAEAALRARRPEAIGPLMNVAHGLMDALGVCDERLASLAYRLRALAGIAGAKISGAGLGDCVIGWGGAAGTEPPAWCLPMAMANAGLVVGAP